MITKNEIIVPSKVGIIHHFVNLQSDGVFTVNFYFEIQDDKNNIINNQHGDEGDYISDNYYEKLKSVFVQRKENFEAQFGNTSRCLWRLMDISQNTRTINLRATIVDSAGNYKNTKNIPDKNNFNGDDLAFINDFIDLQRAKITNLALAENISEYGRNIDIINNLTSKVVVNDKTGVTNRFLNYIAKRVKVR